jgi:hypothetical protein
VGVEGGRAEYMGFGGWAVEGVWKEEGLNTWAVVGGWKGLCRGCGREEEEGLSKWGVEGGRAGLWRG